ncbi:phytanoyl-CoA dioxygenase family protein [Bradyrhizobium sp. Pear77]|uniref:phytanoyl-CoA dioxygenase family protein n=1 Tax=Bradyrhizobium altum TaxID=1571202 RepID=UPI00289AC57A|nr:phytanoyl-CoA dioxygenase family protein [Bradyrhizobium altum]MCC8957520.1 phytanoyl-CoA dioxygenase family protein [Bradyrhizobium altum]
MTDEEVAHFAEHGWVMLRGLLDAQLARDLLDRAKAMTNLEADQSSGVLSGVRNAIFEADPLFARLALSASLGKMAAQLLGERVAMRRLEHKLMVKPAEDARKRTRPTMPHQDHLRPFRSNAAQFWIALDEVTPEMGSMWFLGGSQKFGLLGGGLLGRTNELVGPDEFASLEAVFDRFPRLRQCELSEPQRYAPGDVTVHHGLTLHGASANTTDRTRWAYRVVFFPADAIYTGEPNYRYTDGLGLSAGQQFDHPNFPVVWTPQSL